MNYSINIGFTVDNKYVKYLAVTIISILKNSNNSEEFNFYILNDGNITQKNKSLLNKLKRIKHFNIKWVTVNTNDYVDQGTNLREDITITTNYRFSLASVLPDIEKIIFLDADLIVQGSLSALWQLDIANYYMACCPWLVEVQDREYNRKLDIPDEYLYTNTGVMLVNLNKWREDNVEKEFFINAKKYRSVCKFLDQDVLNITLYKNIYYLNQKWNFRPSIWFNLAYYKNNEYKEAFDNPQIIHWADPIKPWQKDTVKYFNVYRNYAKLTSFFKEIYKDIETEKRKIFISKLFSIKNNYKNNVKSHKIITVLGIKFKIRQNNVNNKNDKILPVLPRLEVHVVDHCNLNCKGCTHYCNVANEKFIKIEDYVKDLEEISKKLDFQEIKIMGGEPLLHKEIHKFIRETRRIVFISNCLLLDTASEEFWDAMRDTNTFFNLTKYPVTNNKFTHYLDLIVSKNVLLGNIHVANEFWLIHNPNGNSNPQEMYQKCEEAYCRQLRDGKLYICPDACYMDYYNAYFNKNIPVDKGIDIYSHNSYELYNYLTTPKETCKFCTYKKIVPWEQSQKKYDEWNAIEELQVDISNT